MKVWTFKDPFKCGVYANVWMYIFTEVKSGVKSKVKGTVGSK